MKALAEWFTPERRQAIQAFFGTLAPLFILAGFGSEGDWEQILIITGAVLQFLASALSLVNVRGHDAWTVIRGAVYTLAATVAPALVLLGWLNEDLSALIMTSLSLALSSLSSLLAILVNGEQQLTQALHSTANSPAPAPNPFER